MSELANDRARWEGRYARDLETARPPSSWVIDACERIPREACIVDVACGSGRHALALARRGREVIAIDFIEKAVRHAAGQSARLHGVVGDAASLPFAPASLDALLCVNFLVRPLFETFKSLLKPGGFLVYETYTIEHRRLVDAGRSRAPRSPDYVLEPGELATLAAPLTVLDSREGFVEDEAGARYCASVIARSAVDGV